MKSKCNKAEDMTCPLWMMTFGDCMSLLVTFFVMLIAFTNMETQQMMDMLGGLKGALGIAPSTQSRITVSDDATRISGMSVERQWLSIDELSAIVPDAQMAVKRFGKPTVGDLNRHLIIGMLDVGMIFIINAIPLFEENGSTLLSGSHDMLEQIADFVAAFENEIQIVAVVPEVNVKDNAKGKSGTGLAIERAMAVRSRLASSPRLEPDRFAVGSRAASDKDDDVPFQQRIEIFVVGKRSLEDISPEEIVVKDKWH